MKKHLSNPAKTEDDGSDALSTATHNSGHHSPSALHAHQNEETDSIGDGSKKIRKKRNAYQKIEDDVRLKLLEAVQKHGETLKSAAKKYKINYSSAKSILHTYRKEGRILKKSAQERNIKRHGGAGDGEDSPLNEGEDTGLEMASETNLPQKAPLGSNNGRMEIDDDSKENVDVNRIHKPKSAAPLGGMVDNFVNLLKLGAKSANEGQPEEGLKRPSHQVFTPKALNKNVAKLGQSEGVWNNLSKNASQMENKSQITNPLALAGNLSSLINSSGLNNLFNLGQLLQGGAADKLKLLENIYGNQPTSPKSGAAEVDKENSEALANQARLPGKENEILSEVANLMQNVQKGADDNIIMPHPVRFNSAQLMQEKIESKLGNVNDDSDWNGTIENAAIETFKSFMDAQLLLCDALKKASYLNNLMQIQKSKAEAEANNMNEENQA